MTTGKLIAWGLSRFVPDIGAVARVVPDDVKEQCSAAIEYPANGSFFVPLVAPKPGRAPADEHSAVCTKELMVKPHG